MSRKFILNLISLSAVFVAPTALAQALISPLEAIAISKATPEKCLNVMVQMDVRGSGESRGRHYLNSEPDYRSTLSLNVAIQPETVSRLTMNDGTPPKDRYLNSCIIVTGRVCQVGIYVRGSGTKRPVYFQTQLPVFDPNQIEMCDLLIS